MRSSRTLPIFPEEATRLAKLREFRRKNKENEKTSVNLVPRNLSCSPIIVPSPFAEPYRRQRQECSKKDKTKTYIINQCSFNGETANGIIIDKPGVYKFVENVNFEPTVERTTAITITASNVVLDLGSFVLAQTNTVFYTYGIAIARDVSFVKITGVKNVAKILDFTLSNIRILGRTTSITLENITVTQTQVQNLTNDNIPADCSPFLCSYINTGMSIGEGDTGYISMLGTDRANKVSKISLVGVTASRSAIGCHMVFASEIEVLDSWFIENTYYGYIAGNTWIVADAPGVIAFPICYNGVLRNCRFDENRSDSVDVSNPGDTYNFDFLSGVSFYQSSDFLIENCTVNDNFNTGTILSVDHDGSHNMVWRDCVFLRNKSQFESCDGLHFSGTVPRDVGPCATGAEFPILTDEQLTVERCSSLDNSTEEGGRCVGFMCASGQKAVFTDCHSAKNRNTFGPYACGFLFVGGGRVAEGVPLALVSDVSLQSCTAQANDGGGLVSAGVLFTSGITNAVVRNLVATGNGNTAGNITAGIAFDLLRGRPIDPRASSQNFVIDDSIISGNGNDESSFSGGIVVNRSEVFELSNISIQKDTLAYNKGVGIGVYGDVKGVSITANKVNQNTGVGIDVSQNPNPVLIAYNTAYSNGDGTYAGNYASNNPPIVAGLNPNIIVTGTQNNLPLQVGAQNTSIIIA